MNITVATTDLLNALKAVTPHAFPKADIPSWHRVRLDIGKQNVHVSAHNGVSAGHAIVSVWDGNDTTVEQAVLDLSPLDVRAITSLFVAGKENDDAPDATLRIESDDERVVITDAGGMFDGRSLQLSRYPTEVNFPPIASMLAAKLAMDDGKSRKPQRPVLSGHILGLFSKASAVYAEPLVISPGNGERDALLIACGESFLGLVSPQRLADDELSKVNGWRADWIVRLGDHVQQEM